MIMPPRTLLEIEKRNAMAVEFELSMMNLFMGRELFVLTEIH